MRYSLEDDAGWACVPSKPVKVAKSPPADVKELDARFGDSSDWRNVTSAKLRALLKAADPEVVEEIKWRKASNAMLGVAVYSHDGLIGTLEMYKDKVKFTFAKGAALPDARGVFNLDDAGATRRAIDLREDERVDEKGFKDLVRAAVALNQS